MSPLTTGIIVPSPPPNVTVILNSSLGVSTASGAGGYLGVLFYWQAKL